MQRYPFHRLYNLKMEADIVAFKVGDRFNTFKEFEETLETSKSTNFVDFWRRDCRTIEAASRRGITRPMKVQLLYHELKYCCIHGGQAYRCRGKGSRSTS